MSAVLYKRVFIALTILGTVSMGVLLFLLFKNIDGMRRGDHQRLVTMQLLDEMRSTSRMLTSLARIKVTMGSLDAEMQYRRTLEVLEGNALRPKTAAVQPGRLISFKDLLEEQPFTPTEMAVLHEALEAYKELRGIEQKAMRQVSTTTPDDENFLVNQGVINDSLRILFSDTVQNASTALLRSLDNLGAGILARLGAHEDRTLNTIALQAVALCGFFVLTGTSLLVLGYAGHSSFVTGGRNLRLYTSILLALLVALAGPICLVYLDARNLLTSSLEKRQALICREVYRELALRSTLAQELTRIQASFPAVRRYVEQENKGVTPDPAVRAHTYEMLSSIAVGYTDASATLLLDHKGMVLLTTQPGSPLRKQYILPKEDLQRVLGGETYITPLNLPTYPQHELAVLTPVLSTPVSGQVVGAVVSLLDKRNSFQIWEDRISPEERMNVFIIDKDGTVLLSSRGVDTQTRTPLTEPITRLVKEGVQGLRYYTDGQGVDRVGYFIPVPEFGWTVGVSSAVASSIGLINNMLVRATIVGAGAVLLAIIFFTLLMKTMVRDLRMANERMSKLVESMGMYTWSYSVLQNTFTYSHQWHTVMDLPGPPQAGTWTLAQMHAALTPESLQTLMERLRVGKEGEYIQFDATLTAYNGEIRHVRVLGHVDRVGNDGVQEFSGMAQDVTAVKLMAQSEEQLRLSNERMTELMYGVGIHTWEFDATQNSFAYDAQWAINIRMPEPQAGAVAADYLMEHMHHPDDIKTVQYLLGKHELGQYRRFDMRIRTNSEDYVWHRSIARVAALDASGNAVAYTGMGYDITAEKTLEKSEELLRQQSAHLEAANARISNIMHALGMFMWEFNKDANSYNYDAQWHRIMELPGTPTGGTWTLDYLFSTGHPDDVDNGLEYLTQATEGGFLNFDTRHYTRSGREVWLRIMARVDKCDERGHATVMSGMGYDITATKSRERSEAEYKQQLEELVAHRTAELEESRNQAEAASQAKTVFLSTVSHEIRTPMNAIVGFAHLFDRSNLTRTQKDHLEKIKLSSETLLGVINDVLDISKIEAGRLELERVAFSLHGTLDTVCSIVEYAAINKGLKLESSVAEDVPPLIMGDPKRISQILLNLMNNAVKFTAVGSVRLDVAVEASPPAEEGLPRQVVLAFSVTDTGIGLSEEQMARLFRPFTQADSSVTRKYGGTGLGLAISKQLVELMGGGIGVSSRLDEGSTFRFNLRLDLPQGKETEISLEHGQGLAQDPLIKERLRSLAGVRVLLVEDNEINQEIARSLLEEYGLVVDTAHHGRMALEMVSKQRYACIFMDMQMPVMGGVEATEAMRRMGADAEEAGSDDPYMTWLRQVPIVAMTANALSEDRQRCLQAGMDDHIGKPIDFLLLQRCLLHWIVQQQ